MHTVVPSEVCRKILALEKSIRFAGIASKMGRVAAAEFRKGLAPLLTSEEFESSVIKAVLRMKTREDYESKLGSPLYTFTLYEKVKRASIPLQHEEYALLIVSFDKSADHEGIILDRIRPLLKKEGLLLSES